MNHSLYVFVRFRESQYGSISAQCSQIAVFFVEYCCAQFAGSQSQCG